MQTQQSRAQTAPRSEAAAQTAQELRAAIERARAAINRRAAEGKAPARVNAIPPTRDYATTLRRIAAALGQARRGVGGEAAAREKRTAEPQQVARPASTGIERSQPRGDLEETES